MGFEDVARALGATHYRGRYWKFRCPCHDDSSPSAEVWQKGDRVFIGCWVCTPPGTSREIASNVKTQMLRAAGLDWKDMQPEIQKKQHPRTNGKVTATYDYVSEDGEVLYRKCRVEPGRNGRKKDFFFERPVNGGWALGIEGVKKRVLYRLPELLDAVKRSPTEWIWLCAGEKDADNGAAIGLATTTTCEGEGVWPEYATNALAGCRVAILPDRDEVGWRHAGQVIYALRTAGCRVKLLDVPHLSEKGDLTDFLESHSGSKGHKLWQALMLLESGVEFPPFQSSKIRQ